MPAALAAVLERARRDAEAYTRTGDRMPAGVLVQLVNEIQSTDEWALLLWITEARAAVRSGHDARWFRRRFAEWQAAGLARETPNGREYRACVLPQRADVGQHAEAEADRLLGRSAA